VLWDNIDVSSTDQRAHEEWACQQDLKLKQKAEEAKGNKITRDAAKARHQPKSNATAPPRKRARKSYDQDDSSGPGGSKTAFNVDQLLEINADSRNHFSWRRQDAFGVLLLASALKLLCRRTITLSSIRDGEQYLLKYLKQCAEVRPDHCATGSSCKLH
jgi:hypothetical protein